MYAMAETYAQNAAAMAKDPPYPDRPLRPDETRSPSGITRKRKATKGKTSKKKIKEGKLPNYKELSGNEEHLKWRDKTAHARQGLFAKVTKAKGTIRIDLAHTMDYGVYLELAHQRKYAVIEPVIKKLAPEFFAEIQRMMKE
jgi:hypothetical protein